MPPLSIWILLAVFILTAIRQVGRFRLQIWHVMLGGAVAALVTLQISPVKALESINPDVMFFLFGMFVVGEALEQSGYLEHLSYKLFKRARTTDQLVLLMLFGLGTASALLMNDTLAIIGTPVVLAMSKRHEMSPKLMMLALAFAITIGSVVSPIGNPQNLLIALGGGMKNSFVTFARYLLVPTLLNLLLAYLVLRLFFKKEFHSRPLVHEDVPLRDPKLAMLAKASLVLILALVATKIIIVASDLEFDLRLTYIALAASLPIIAVSPKRAVILKGVDWSTLVFFASMFVLMAAVWNSGFFQGLIEDWGIEVAGIAMIIIISVLLSQVISNVPLVALYIPMLVAAGAGDRGFMALAAGSTIAGNLLILGAASNVIIIQNAEKKSGQTLTFWDFARVGIPLTAINIAVYALFFIFA
jgi:Na+/H+ antiporter NhaD/arsenite permease-like protein